jgi:hypothetical protein
MGCTFVELLVDRFSVCFGDEHCAILLWQRSGKQRLELNVNAG